MKDCYILVDDCIVAVLMSDWEGPQSIASTIVQDAHVSTVFLGIEHVGGMFETMIFGGPVDEFQIRCNTAKQAREIHNRIVKDLQSVDWLQWHLNGHVDEDIKKLLITVKEQHDN